MERILQEAAEQFFLPEEGYELLPTLGGVNNHVHLLRTKAGEHFILRVYNNGNNTKKVIFEHEVLEKLNQLQLSFEVPKLIPNRINRETHILLSNGAETCLAHVIRGKLPKLASCYEIGVASGELYRALSHYLPKDFSIPAPTPPYYDLYAAHPLAERPVFHEYMQSLPETFPELTSTIAFIIQAVLDMETLLIELHTKQLPKQYIHGDLHYDNVLIDEQAGQVTAILDFEFTSYDWRGMELSICLSKYASETNALQYFDDFIRGFMVHGELTPIEREVITDLMKLRILSNVVFFVGRAIAKEDLITTLTSRLAAYEKRIRLLDTHRQTIIDMINKYAPTS
jgi:homoserine kinase type II